LDGNNCSSVIIVKRVQRLRRAKLKPDPFVRALHKAALKEAIQKVAAASLAAAMKQAARKGAYEIAKNGGKHAGFLKNYVGKAASEIQKAVKSYQKQIATHQDKIANPKKYYPGWDKLNPAERAANLNRKWPDEIQNAKEQIESLENILGSKGGGS
jgi:histone H3/H4